MRRRVKCELRVMLRTCSRYSDNAGEALCMKHLRNGTCDCDVMTMAKPVGTMLKPNGPARLLVWWLGRAFCSGWLGMDEIMTLEDVGDVTLCSNKAV